MIALRGMRKRASPSVRLMSTVWPVSFRADASLPRLRSGAKACKLGAHCPLYWNFGGVVLPLTASEAASISPSYTADAAPKNVSIVTRYLARLFNFWLETSLLTLPLVLFLVFLQNTCHFPIWDMPQTNPYLVPLGLITIALRTYVQGAVIYAVCGNTPGKALLGIHITTGLGGKPTFRNYLQRNLNRWLISNSLHIFSLMLIANTI